MTALISNMVKIITKGQFQSMEMLLDMKMCLDMDRFLGVKKLPTIGKLLVMKQSRTPLHKKVASATNSNKILLFLRGRGHHW